MKRLVMAAFSLSLLGGVSAYAQQDDRRGGDHPRPPAAPAHQAGPQGAGRGPSQTQQHAGPPQGRPQQGAPQQIAPQQGRSPQIGQQGFNRGSGAQSPPANRAPGFQQGRGGQGYGGQGHVWRAPQRFRGSAYFFPRGYGYQVWGFGEYLPAPFFASDYILYDYGYYGLQPPPPGFEWVRVGHDALLVRPGDGYILDVARDLFF